MALAGQPRRQAQARNLSLQRRSSTGACQRLAAVAELAIPPWRAPGDATADDGACHGRGDGSAGEIQRHLESFLEHVHDASGKRLPKYVENEFRRYLACGLHAYGFARAVCE